MAKWSTPGVVFREIDNSIQNNTAPGNGRGAIVINANQGYPNQRVLSTSLNDFYNVFGTPENPNQFGHFAAANYFGAGSEQLLAIRATQGDEEYAQIQYPYTNASSKDADFSRTEETLQFVDNSLIDNVKIIDDIRGYANVEKLEDDGWFFDEKDSTLLDESTDMDAFGMKSLAVRAPIKDVYTETAETFMVFRDATNQNSTELDPVHNYITANGAMWDLYKDPRTTSSTGNHTRIPFVSEAIATLVPVYSGDYRPDTVTNNEWYFEINESVSQGKFYKVGLQIPESGSMLSKRIYIDTMVTSAFIDSLDPASEGAKKVTDKTLEDLLEAFKEASSVDPETGDEVTSEKNRCEIEDIALLNVLDWSDLELKNYIVETSAFNETDNFGQAYGIKFKEYGMTDYTYDLTFRNTNVQIDCKVCNEMDIEELNEVAAEYGLDPTEINNEKYAVLKYPQASSFDIDDPTMIEKLVYADEFDDDAHITGDNKDDAKTIGFKLEKNLFLLYHEAANIKPKPVTVSVFDCEPCKVMYQPWVIENNSNTLGLKMTALSTTEIMADTSGVWADGYTPKCDTEDEPGNGDIELYSGPFENQLVIGAIGPGEFGNNIGVSVITAEAAQYKCLHHQNAFNWKYRFDDEDLVDANSDDYTENEKNLTWKKVYRINVYVKSKDKTAAVWGTGLDALLSDPIESWYVSNDSTAKDAEGNSLYAPYVINGKSQYIYVSKKHVGDAVALDSSISQPMMTWSIFQLTGGKNSSLNNVKEKTAALKLYTDRQMADFDILFNVEPIDTFNGRQRFAAHQRRIAEIAAQRGMDIGVIQVTARDAKTCKQELSQGKGFSFTNGSYVASYAGYDKYFDSYTSTWVYLPKSVAGACAMCYCDVYAYPWMAPAGTTRGGIAYSTQSLPKHTEAEIGQLYDNNINISKNTRGYGEILWGQKTMLKKDSALNRINVRRLLNYIEKNLESMLIPYLYQNNTVSTRTQMFTTVDSFLSRIQAADGLISKNVEIKTDPDDAHIVYVNISLIPAESIEWICVTLTVNRNTGVSAEEG